MKAFLLAAGKGTRLRPLTLHMPKCLVPIRGKPLMAYWFDLFETYEIHHILVNTSHHADNVREFVKTNARGLNIKLTYEEQLLGSGGTIRRNWDFIKDEEKFFVFYADNLTNINLDAMQAFHRESEKDFTIAVLRVPNPQECGVVELDNRGTVVSFTEKPKKPASNLAFAGIMLSTPRLKDFFPDKEIFDLGYEVLPRIIGVTAGYVMNDYLLDIGDVRKLKQAEEDIQNGILIW